MAKKSKAASRLLAQTESADTNEILDKNDWKEFLCSECKEMVTMTSAEDYRSVYYSDIGSNNDDGNEDERSIKFEQTQEEVDRYYANLLPTSPSLERWPAGIVKIKTSLMVDLILVDQAKESCECAVEVCVAAKTGLPDLDGNLATDPKRKR